MSKLIRLAQNVSYSHKISRGEGREKMEGNYLTNTEISQN